MTSACHVTKKSNNHTTTTCRYQAVSLHLFTPQKMEWLEDDPALLFCGIKVALFPYGVMC